MLVLRLALATESLNSTNGNPLRINFYDEKLFIQPCQ